jgi:3-hydroxyacyl-[acyl-carrier-protein] dehydratase
MLLLKRKSVKYEELLKTYKKKPIVEADLLDPVWYDMEEIKKIVPHREPFLLVDTLTGINVESGIIRGVRFLDPAEPVFAGHFPDFPVYPGSLQIEMIGQLGLCLSYFLENETSTIDEKASPVQVRATKVLGAHYLKPLLPGTTVTLLAQKLDFDGFFATMIGQALDSEGSVAGVAIEEVVFV